MKITKVETIVVSMPMIIEGSVMPKQGGKPRTSMDTLLVKIETDEGVTGWGEGFGHRIFTATKAALDSFIGPMCIGRDPTQISTLVEELQRNLGGVGRNGPAMYALSAVDIALWDIAGKLAKLPLYRLLGGAHKTELPAYASLLRYGEPAAVTQYVERALKRGYRHIKLHEITVEPIKAARIAAGPDIPIMIDCNCPWTIDEAITMARRLQEFDPHWLEEPIWPPEDHAGLARVRTHGGLRTAAGENAMLPEFKSMFEHDALTFAQSNGACRRVRRHCSAAFRILWSGTPCVRALHRRDGQPYTRRVLRRRLCAERYARCNRAEKQRLHRDSARSGAWRGSRSRSDR